MNKLFSHHFWGLKIEIFDSRTSCKPIRFSCSFLRVRKCPPVLSGIMNEQIYLPTTNYSLTKRLILTVVRYHIFFYSVLSLVLISVYPIPSTGISSYWSNLISSTLLLVIIVFLDVLKSIPLTFLREDLVNYL